MIRASLGGVLFATIVWGQAHAADVAAPSTEAVTVANWTTQLNSEVRYFSWRGARGDPTVRADGTPSFGGRGSEIYTPTTLSVTGLLGDGLKLEALLRSGYVAAHQSTNGVSGTVGTPTDTVPSMTLTYLGIDGFQPFASLSLNLPTGKPALYASNANARMDSDLVDVPSFGEGFNVGPTIGANIPLSEAAVATISAGYTARGNFHQDGVFSPFFPQATNTVHPGDLFTVSTSITAQVAPWSFQLAVNYSRSGKAQNNGVDQLEPGQSFSISGLIGYAFTDQFSIRALPSFSYSTRNRSPAPPVGGLATEAINSNSALVSIRVEPTYQWEKLSFGPVAAFQYRDRNAYDQTTLDFVPAKTRVTVGGQAGYALTEKAAFNARLEHVWTHVSPGSLFVGVPGVARDAYVAVIGGTFTF